jgi:hypothetical protein
MIVEVGGLFSAACEEETKGGGCLICLEIERSCILGDLGFGKMEMHSYGQYILLFELQHLR